MANVSHIHPNELTEAEELAGSNSVSKSSPWSSCCGLKVKHPADVIQIFQSDDSILGTGVEVTRFWTGSHADESLLSSGQYVLVEIQNRSNLIFKSKSRKHAECAENPKLLIPTHTAERIGFSRLASVGPVVQKTADCTFTMQKVDSEEACKGSTAVYMNNQVFKLDTRVHEKSRAQGIASIERHPNSSLAKISEWSVQSLRDLFSFKMLFLMALGRYGLSLADAKYRLMESDLVRLWVKDAYNSIVDYFFHGGTDESSPTWYESLWKF